MPALVEFTQVIKERNCFTPGESWWEWFQPHVWAGGGGVVVVGKCQFVKMGTFGSNISALTNFCLHTARKAQERQRGECITRTHHPHTRRIPWGWGCFVGLLCGAVFWGCILGLPLGAAAKLCPISRCSTGQDAKSGAFAFLALQTEGKMGLKRDLEVRCWGSPLN